MRTPGERWRVNMWIGDPEELKNFKSMSSTVGVLRG